MSAISNCSISSWIRGVFRLLNFFQYGAWCVISVLICISLITNDIENLFMYLQVSGHPWKVSVHYFLYIFLLGFFSISYCFRGSYICCKYLPLMFVLGWYLHSLYGRRINRAPKNGTCGSQASHFICLGFCFCSIKWAFPTY